MKKSFYLNPVRKKFNQRKAVYHFICFPPYIQWGVGSTMLFVQLKLTIFFFHSVNGFDHNAFNQ